MAPFPLAKAAVEAARMAGKAPVSGVDHVDGSRSWRRIKGMKPKTPSSTPHPFGERFGVERCVTWWPNDDLFIYAGGLTPDSWDNMLVVMGREDLIGDERYATNEARMARRNAA
jgi:crotonobetainyl-CoA:carnitine CoA-transferase CaiB-like acyl-CoA transferase